MRTDELIRAMAADTTRPAPVEQLLPATLAGALAISAACFLAALGVRADLGATLGETAVWLKHVFPGTLAAAGLGAALRLSYPGARLGGWGAALVLPVALVAVAALGAAAALPPAGRMAALVTENTLPCLLSILLMAGPMLAGGLWALRRGACTRPRLGGALIGLVSGSAAATVYALHCTEDSPVFYGVWYSLGIAGATALGALLGARMLRW